MFIISCFSNKAGFLYTCYKGLYKRTKLPGGVASELKMDNTELSSAAQAVHSHRGRNTVKKKEFTNSRPGKPGFIKGAAEAQMLPLCSGWRPGPRPGRVAPPTPSCTARSSTRAVGRRGGQGQQPGDAAELAAGAGTGGPERAAGGRGAEAHQDPDELTATGARRGPCDTGCPGCWRRPPACSLCSPRLQTGPGCAGGS